ncbi:SRPBCC family protein [Amycolatopsis pithecellobii]|uniref:Carbon monoxide dehydrogenase n=1 Tax=Amycolatopsis pithecellobii TaxID=664692 RepID=A0A6N7YLJ7_9PSEU|nr:SRPBCC family protein [Amycolatopsis pithecellobii]MTD52778.1 carbon monoxide dehydrogenase [Amycolatopsis pithecellobii]
MRLDHEFSVPVPPAEVWKAVTDPESVAPCMPGATLTKVEGDSFTGTVKVKLGPISLLYKGSGEFLEKDEAARKIVIKASGKDSRGAGTAAATVTVTLREDGGQTKGAVETDLNVTGRPAQFGRGMITEVGGKILDQFAANLAEKLTATESPATPASTTEPESEPAKPAETTKPAEAGTPVESPAPKETEAIDLFDLAGSSVVKRLAPALAGLAGLLVIVAIIRMLRRR